METLRSTELKPTPVHAELIVDHGEDYIIRLINHHTGHQYDLLKTKNYEYAKAEFGYLLDMFEIN